MNRLLRWAAWLLMSYLQAAAGLYHVPSMQKLSYEHLSIDSYFGYSISYQENTKRLIVGAPKDNVVGQVYTIDVDSGTVSPVPTPQKILDKSNKIESKITSHKNFLLGISVEAGSDFFVTCAPRSNEIYKYQAISNNKRVQKQKLMMDGCCFYDFSNGTVHIIDDKKFTPDDLSTRPYGYDLDIFNEGVLISAPTSYGGVVKVVQSSSKEIRLPTKYEGFSFGFAVASGNYLDSKNMKHLYYAISTPFGENGLGKVYIYDAITLESISVIMKHKVGMMFGASLCTVNLGEVRDFLLIGSPAYSADKAYDVDVGAVYLYSPEDIVTGNSYKVIRGHTNEGYFGKAIANLGDIDGDGKEEVVIGAPYEDEGRGAVYIYSGDALLDQNSLGDRMLIQKIQPEANSGILSFGFSLTSIQDYDNNGCNELAVGAPWSNSVLTYKCFTYITINLTAIFPPKKELRQGVQNSSSFNFEACVNVVFPEKPQIITEKIKMTVKIVHQDLILSKMNKGSIKKNEITFDLLVSKENNLTGIICESINVTILKTENFDKVMLYTITAAIANDPRKSAVFDGKRVLLSDRSSLVVNEKEPLADCDGPCKSTFRVQYKSNMSRNYIVGSTSESAFSFVIHNVGDTAYTVCLLIQVEGAPLRRPPAGCTVTDTTASGVELVCTPNVLLKNGVDWITGDITLDTSALTSLNEKITVTHKLYSVCRNRTSPDIMNSEQYTLTGDSDGIALEGVSDPSDIVDIFSESSRISHIYTISNFGTSTWGGVNVDIVLTKKNDIDYENIVVETGDEKRLYCQMAKKTEDEFHAKCKSVYLKKGSLVKVIIPFVVSPSPDGKVETLNVSTVLTVHLKDDAKDFSINTQLEFKTSSVPLWIIITASLVGLLLLVLLAYGLYKFGFLKRGKKEDLEKLKRNVNRQSMIRDSMRRSRMITEARESKRRSRNISENENADTISDRNSLL